MTAPAPSQDPDLRLSEPLDQHAIGAMLKRRGTSLTQVARDAGLYESACRLATISKGYPEAEQAIARAVGHPVEVLWPERYPSGSQRSPNRKQPKKSRQNDGASVTSARAPA